MLYSRAMQTKQTGATTTVTHTRPAACATSGLLPRDRRRHGPGPGIGESSEGEFAVVK
jgi:hypothetical protein